MELERNRDRRRIRPAGSELEAGQKIEKGKPKLDEGQVRKADRRAAQERVAPALGQTATKAAAQHP